MSHAARLRRRARLAVAVAAALLCVAPALAGAVVSNGHSGWAWASPSPQGEAIADLSFNGASGYAVGGFGTLLRSTDGGQTWIGLPSGTTQALGRVIAVGSTGLVAAGGCAVRRSADDGATVASVDVGGGAGEQGCGSNVLTVAFADALNGLIVFEGGVVLATADGGLTLSRRTPVPGPSPSDVVATSPTTAFATSLDSIYRTTDGASSWTLVGQTPRSLVPFVPPRTLRSIVFASASVGYVAGDGGTVMRTTDGGATWSATASAGPLDLARVRCADERQCLFTTSTTPTTIVRTADGGSTYTQVTAAGTPLHAVAFASPQRAVAAGDGGVTVVSDDGGASWRPIGSTIGTDLTRVVGRPGGFGYAIGTSTIALTLDGGDSWRTFGIPSPLPIQVAAFADPQTGFAQDTGRTLWRTTNGGSSWQVLDPGQATGLLQDIVPLSRGRVLIVTPTGVARSTDGGQSFTLVDDEGLRRSRVVRTGLLRAAGGGSRAFLVGPRGIVASADAGLSWSALPLPATPSRRRPRIAVGDCATPSTCWIVTTGSRMFRTSTLGRRWVEVTPSVGLPMRLVSRIATGAPGEALVALAGTALPGGPQGVVLHTVDGGATWAPQLVSADPVGSIDALAGRAWALSGGSRVLTTASGGAVGVRTSLSLRASTGTIRGPATVTIAGRLPGARGGEEVSLYASGLRPRLLTVSSAGTFTAVYRLTRTTSFVAQWAGDGVRDGDGTPPLTVERLARRRAG